MALLVKTMMRPASGAVGLAGRTLQTSPAWRPGDRLTTHFFPGSDDPDAPPFPGVLVDVGRGTASGGRAVAVAVEVHDQEPAESGELNRILESMLTVGHEGFQLDDDVTKVPVMVRSGTYSCVIWVDAGKPADVTRVVFSLKLMRGWRTMPA